MSENAKQSYAVSLPQRARERRLADEALGRAIIAAHHGVFPLDVDIQYLVTQRNGKVRVKFEPPAVCEAGWTNS